MNDFCCVMSAIRTEIARKVYTLIAGKKSASITLSTARGNFFIDIAEKLFGKAFNITWGEYSKSDLVKAYHTIAEVYAPVHQRASRVADGNYQVKKISDDSIVFDNKDLNRLMSQPNPLQNFKELIYEMSALRAVTGENFLYAAVPDTLKFDYKNIAALWNLPSENVCIKTNSRIKLLSATTIGDIVQAYDVNAGTSNMSIKPELVLYTKYTSLYASDNKIFGRSPLQSAKMPIDNLKEVYAARNTQYKKRGALGFISSEKSDADGTKSLTKEEKKEIREGYESDYGLDGTKSPVGIVGSPVKFTKVGATIAEMEPFTETKASAMAIYSVLKVPRTMMPSDEGATYENAKQEERGFYQNEVIPEAKSIALSLTNHWRLAEFGLYIDVSYDHVEVLQEDKQKRAESDWKNNETYRIRFLHGIITLNEWRVAAGLEKAKNKLYDKLIFDMDDTQRQIVSDIIKISKGGTGNDNQNTQADVTGVKQ